MCLNKHREKKLIIQIVRRNSIRAEINEIKTIKREKSVKSNTDSWRSSLKLI